VHGFEVRARTLPRIVALCPFYNAPAIPLISSAIPLVFISFSLENNSKIYIIETTKPLRTGASR